MARSAPARGPHAGRLPTVALAVAAVALVPRAAHAYCRTTTRFMQTDPEVCPTPMMGVPLAWPGSCMASSINATLLPAGISRDELRAQVTAAGARWSSATCDGGGSPSFHFVEYPDCNHPAGWHPNGANANTVEFSDDWGNDPYHPPEAIAVTITTFDTTTGEIRDADTEMNLRTDNNPDGFDFTTGPPDPSSADLPTILTHELGHAQGLAHASDRMSVMWYRAGLGEQRRDLTADDIAGICAIYPPSRTAACMPEPHGGFECAPGCGCRASGRSRGGWGALALAAGALAVVRRQRARRG